mmetsp:Transcript_12778/g.21602  ORF Transcript_12778/g.21602 Transcript_12778/m.21602 type:complete len:87 (-) Transcript_12778:7-267(-)
MTRDKMIYKLKVVRINKHYFILHVLASAGTYIKEFVHGDLGRTTPNVGGILNCEADILQLDVTEVYDSVEAVDLESDSWYNTPIII